MNNPRRARQEPVTSHSERLITHSGRDFPGSRCPHQAACPRGWGGARPALPVSGWWVPQANVGVPMSECRCRVTSCRGQPAAGQHDAGSRASTRAQTPPEDLGSGALSSADICPGAPCPDGPEEMAVTGG